MMPARPKWDYELKRGKLHSRERKAFVRWISGVKTRLREEGKGTRQRLSRTSRCGASCGASSRGLTWPCSSWTRGTRCLHTPPALYAHVARRLRKPLVLVLNKVDAIPRRAAEEWGQHLLAACRVWTTWWGSRPRMAAAGRAGRRR